MIKRNKELRKNIKKFNKNIRYSKRVILNNASRLHMNAEEYTKLCKSSWMTLILYSNNFPAALLYTYEFYLKKYKCYNWN